MHSRLTREGRNEARNSKLEERRVLEEIEKLTRENVPQSDKGNKAAEVLGSK